MYLLQRPEDIPPRLSGRLNVRIAILTALAGRGRRHRRPPALVAAGARWPALPGPGAGPRRPRCPRAPPARRDPRPQRQGPGRQPHGDEPRDAALRPAQRSGERRAELRRLGGLAGLSQGEIRRKVRRDAAVRGLPGRPPPGRRPPPALLPAREPGPVPRRPGRAHLRPRLQGRLAGGPRARHRRPGHARISSTRPAYRSLKPGDIIGQAGVEYTYDRYLRGHGRGASGSRSTRSAARGASSAAARPAPATTSG